MSVSPVSVSDEPLTPAGRLFLSPELDTIIHCIIRGKDPINIDAVKQTIESSLMLQHPRFCSLLMRDRNGNQYWKRTEVDLDRHVIVINSEDDSGAGGEDDDEAAVNQYVADLSVSTPLSTDKPLWETHLLMAHRCAVFRIHHALGDGISLMSILITCCRKIDDPEALPTMITKRDSGPKEGKWWDRLCSVLMMVCFTFVFVLEFVLRATWVSDRKTVISGGAGVELWPRKLATANCLPDSNPNEVCLLLNSDLSKTINDVFLAVVSSGISRYLDHRSQQGLQKGLRITAEAMVNLRKPPSLEDLTNFIKNNTLLRLGNQFGVVLIPIYCRKSGDDPLQYLKQAKKTVDQKKHSLEAPFTYKVGDLVMSWLGPKYASVLNYRIVCNTTFTISNVIGPQEQITLAGNPIAYIRVNTSSLPHALTMHMVSYAGRADIQLLVAKDIIPDPEFLAKCFEDALIEMKEAAIATAKC
ncbi:hypothetical protein SLEP1_g32463 [Rubroshorea leprosula]|uniref:Diacylglycerol O-acyltransferase n=1 Tax=Rubroshorea leprosula TaxID=152421 RepID=A0AAV5KDE0_9ROSI|nr:hypothetical protein SLEP1_g32463 [Rubroshorea leprosula]